MGRHVIDLTDDAAAGLRIEDYKAAFGLPSMLHEQPSPEQPHRHGVARLQALLPRRRRQ